VSDPRGAAGGSATDLGPALPHPTTSTGEASVEPGAPAGHTETEHPDTEHPDTEHPDAEHADAVDVDPASPAPAPRPAAPPEEPPLDASVHAHVFDDPLPPVTEDADTPLFTATLAPRAPEATKTVAPAAEPGTPTAEARTAAHPARHTLVAPPVPLRRRRGFRITVVAAVGVALLGTAGLAAYLYASATGWRDHADAYLSQSESLAEELSTTRGDLAGAQAELQAVREQLSTAHARITELASEKAQISDEWELTQQVVDYQERVSDAAGQVALALDQCVRSQQELIGYLARAAEESDGGTSGPTSIPPPYDPAQLAQFEADVEAFCQAASEANISLQQELAR